MKKKIHGVIENLEESLRQYDSETTATIGFDGFIDYIVRVVKSKKSKHENVFFKGINEFGAYISEKSGKSCSIEIIGQMTKTGGNMPIMATALGRLGTRVNCIGALGLPDIRREFAGMRADGCALYSIAEPGITTALEFDDGKVMLADMTALDKISWEGIKSAIGEGVLSELYEKSTLIGLVNWSEIENSTEIWEGVLYEILPCLKHRPGRILFFDLADCSKRQGKDIEKVLHLIEKFSAYGRVVLGMNENESRLAYYALTGNSGNESLERVGSGIYKKLNIDTLVIHPVDGSFAWNKDGDHYACNFHIRRPKLSTGGGDNFNAGFCWAMLMGLDITSSLIIANAISGFYVKNGYCGRREDIMDFLYKWYESI